MSEGAFDLVNSLCRTGEPGQFLNVEDKVLCSPLSGAHGRDVYLPVQRTAQPGQFLDVEDKVLCSPPSGVGVGGA